MHTYTFKIKTTSDVVQKFEQHLNVTRLIYNLAKETKEYAYTKGVKLSKFDIIKQLPLLKNDFPWMKDVHSQTLQATIERLDKGYDKFFSDLKKGVKVSKPKWAKKDRWASVEFKKSAVRLNDKSIKISKIGNVRFFKSREIEGEVKIARIVKKADGYYLKVVTDHTIKKCDNQASIGVDRGISYMCVTSEGEYFENIKTLDKYKNQLRAESRKLSRRKKGGSNRAKQKKVVQKLHLKISRVREDYLHKVSSELAKNYQYVFLEDLDIKKMMRDKVYSRAISDVAWGKFEQFLNYKTEVHKVNAAYTSQTCSNCGHVSKENRKTQAEFKCVSCSFRMNADENACLEILKRGQTLLGANVSH